MAVQLPTICMGLELKNGVKANGVKAKKWKPFKNNTLIKVLNVLSQHMFMNDLFFRSLSTSSPHNVPRGLYFTAKTLGFHNLATDAQLITISEFGGSKNVKIPILKNMQIFGVVPKILPLTLAVRSQWYKIANSPKTHGASIMRSRKLSFETWSLPSTNIIMACRK